jgi:hypothetical protein
MAMRTPISEIDMSKDEIIATLEKDLDQSEKDWISEYTRRRKAEKTLEACLELIKHLQRNA